MIAKRRSGKCDIHLIDKFNLFLFHFLPFPSQLPKMFLFFIFFMVHIFVSMPRGLRVYLVEIKGLEKASNLSKFLNSISSSCFSKYLKLKMVKASHRTFEEDRSSYTTLANSTIIYLKRKVDILGCHFYH
jgi:hypothetical protein